LDGWLLVVAILPRKEEKAQKRIDLINKKTEEIVVKQEFKDVNTVDDLFSQLNKK
jgi:hypothetical protein